MNPEPNRPATDTGGVDAWFTPGRFALLLGLLIAACFPQVIAGFETFFYRDYALFGYPLAFHHRESFWQGEMPLWNPYNDCGVPFTAQWNTLTLYPLSLIYLLLPLPWSLGVFCLAHLLVAGLGMYFLARRWTGSRLAGAVAGVAFAYNGLTWYSLMWPNNIAALGWMPWVLLAVERAWREGGRRILVAGLVGALQMLAGAPEVIMVTWVLVGVVWFTQLCRREIPWHKMILRGAGIGALTGGLAAAQLLPFLDLMKYSQRGAYFAGTEWSMPASGLGNYLVALFHCIPAGQGVYGQHDQYWTGSYYMGVVIAALALLAVWRVRDTRLRVLAAVVVFSLLMALGGNSFFYPLLKKIAPQLGFMRFPIKFVVPATFLIPLLAAFGVGWLRGLSAEQWPKEWKRAVSLGAILAGVMGGIVFLAWRYPQDGDDWLLTLKSALRGVVFLAAGLGCLAVLRRKPEAKPQMIFQSAFIVLLWMDVFTLGPSLSPTVTPNVFQPGAIRAANQWETELHAGQSRVMQTQASLQKMYFGGVTNAAEDVLGRRITLNANINLLDRVPKFDGFYSLYIRELYTVILHVYMTSNDLPALKDFLNVSHASHPTNALEWVRRENFMPFVSAGQTPLFVDDNAARDILTNSAFEPRKNVYLPLTAKAEMQGTNHGAATIVSTNYSTHRIRLTVEAREPAMVAVSQSYYHHWRAYVDGRGVPLWRANYAFQALEVPAGQHQVEVVYEDRGFHAGLVISGCSLAVCAVGWFIRRKPMKA